MRKEVAYCGRAEYSDVKEAGTTMLIQSRLPAYRQAPLPLLASRRWVVGSLAVIKISDYPMAGSPWPTSSCVTRLLRTVGHQSVWSLIQDISRLDTISAPSTYGGGNALSSC